MQNILTPILPIDSDSESGTGTETNAGYVMFTVAGAASAAAAVLAGDLATQIETERVAANAQGKRLRFGSGYFYARRWNPQSEYQVEGSGIDVTYLVSGKDLPFMRTMVQSPSSSALRTWMDDNSLQFDVTALAMGLSFNPLSSDNSYITHINTATNPALAGVRAKMRAYIASNSEHPYTMAASKKSYLGEPFNILRTDENSIYVHGKLRWQNFYLLAQQKVITYDNQSGNFTVGQVLTSSGGATGTIVSVTDSGTTGKIVVSGVTGTFTNNHSITDPLGGAADINGTPRNVWGGTDCFVNTIPEGNFYLGNFTVVGAPPIGEVMKCDVTAMGSGYVYPPLVVFDNTGTGGTGAAAVCTLRVVGGTVTNGGTGYTNGQSVTFSGGGAQKQATGTLIVSGGVITGINITNGGGDRYTSVPTISISGGSGTGAITALMGVGEISLEKGNLGTALSYSGQTGTFTLGETVTGAGGATGTITQDHDYGTTGLLILTTATGTFVNGEVITGGTSGATATISAAPNNRFSHGSDYTSAPTISFSGGSGSGATATCRIDGTVFDADYDVDTSEETFHAHALGCWFSPGIVAENIKGDDLWEGLLDTRYSPFWQAKGIVVDRLCNYKTIPENWTGRLGYGKTGSGGMGVLHDMVVERSARHPYTDDDSTTSTSFATMKATRWMELGGPVNNTIIKLISKGATGTTLGPHESCNGLEVFSIVDENDYQGDQDESYRGGVVQLRGSNIHVHSVVIRGGSDGVYTQDTEQPDSVHKIDYINCSDLTDVTENSHAYRGKEYTTAFKSKVIIGNIFGHNNGKTVRLDKNSDTNIVGKVVSTSIRHSHIDIQDGAFYNIADSLADFTIVPSDLAVSSRKDFGFTGTTNKSSIGQHAVILGASMNPSYTYAGTGTSHTLSLGKRRVINPHGVTVPPLFQDYSKFTITPANETQIQLGLLDTDYSHSLRIAAGSNLTADRVLTLTTGDAARNLILSGDATIIGSNTGDGILGDYTTTNPSTPSAGLVEFSRFRAGNHNLASINPAGLVNEYGRHLSRPFSMAKAAGGGSTVITVNSCTLATGGTATSVTNTYATILGAFRRLTYVGSAAAANLVYAKINPLFARGNAAGIGGFDVRMKFSIEATQSGHAFFAGIDPASSPSDVDPSSLVNMFGVGADAADSNLHLMTNDASGTATKTSLGANFPAKTNGAIYELRIWCKPNDTVLYYSLERFDSAQFVEGSANTDLPVNTTGLRAGLYQSSRADTTVAPIIGVSSIYLEPQDQ